MQSHKLATGGKPSTWFPPGKLVELIKNLLIISDAAKSMHRANNVSKLCNLNRIHSNIESLMFMHTRGSAGQNNANKTKYI